MATIASLLSDNTTNIAAKTEAGSITPTIDGAERVKLINELLDRGITVVADTTALQAVSGANFKQAIVENNAVYKWAASGTANGTTIFNASGGGVWNQVFSGGSSAWGAITGTLSDQTDLSSALNTKQATLVSATNIKTINSTSLLGSGDIEISSGASSLDGLSDVVITGAAAGDILEHNGSSFVNINNSFTVLSGTSWDGSNKYKTSLSGNLALSLNSTKIAGLLVIEDNNSHTLSINGTNIPINATTATVIGFTKANGIYYIVDKDGLTIAIGSPDVAAPTVVSATATDANTIRIVFNESMGAVTTAGWSFKQNGTPITPDSVSGSTTTWDFVVSETMLYTDTILRTYNSGTGATTDLVGNELVSFTDQAVTNSITNLSDINFINANTTGGTVSESPDNTWNVSAVSVYSRSTEFLEASTDGSIIIDITAIGTEVVPFGFDTSSTPNSYFAGSGSWTVCVYVSNTSSQLAYIEQSASPVVTGISFPNGASKKIKIERVSGVFTAYYSTDNGATWTSFRVFSTTSSARVYVKFGSALGAPYTTVKNPIGTNFSV